MLDRRPINRRAFLTNGAAVAGGVAIATPFKALLANGRNSRDRRDDRRDRGRRGCSPDYGPLVPGQGSDDRTAAVCCCPKDSSI